MLFLSFLIHFTLINLCKISQVLSQVQLLHHMFISFHPPTIHFLFLLKSFNKLSCHPRCVTLLVSGFPDSHAGLQSNHWLSSLLVKKLTKWSRSDRWRALSTLQDWSFPFCHTEGPQSVSSLQCWYTWSPSLWITLSRLNPGEDEEVPLTPEGFVVRVQNHKG